MSKAEFAELLRAKGYNAIFRNGEVVVYGINKKLFRIVEGIAKSVGYYDRFNWSGRENDGKA